MRGFQQSHSRGELFRSDAERTMTRQNGRWVAAVAGHGCQAALRRNSPWYIKCRVQCSEPVTQDLKRPTHETTGLGHTGLEPEVSVCKPGRGGRLRRPSRPSKGRHPVSRHWAGSPRGHTFQMMEEPEGKCRNSDIDLVTQLWVTQLWWSRLNTWLRASGFNANRLGAGHGRWHIWGCREAQSIVANQSMP